MYVITSESKFQNYKYRLTSLCLFNINFKSSQYIYPVLIHLFNHRTFMFELNPHICVRFTSMKYNFDFSQAKNI